MDERQLAELTKRVYRLERLLVDLQDRLGVPPAERGPAAVATPSPSTPLAPRPATPAKAPPRDETEVLGRWLARAGAVVLLIGFGFAFKYAVDRGFIGPGARVVLGLAAGVALVVAGEWATRRHWPAWAQAVTAAGIAVSYLSILAATRLYDLLPPAFAFASLVAVVVSGALLALRHESVALSVLALAGGYLNALILATEQPRPVAVFVYLVALDAGVLGLAFVRPWHVLDAVALAGTVIVFGTAAPDASFAAGLTSATLLQIVFLALPAARQREPRRAPIVLAVSVIAPFVYFGYVMALLGSNALEDAQGAFTVAMGATYASLAALLHRRDARLATSMLMTALAFGALFIPVQFEGAQIPAGWAVEGALLVGAARRPETRPLRIAGAVLLGLSLWALPAVADRLTPPRLLLSGPGLVFLIETCALGIVAWLLRRDPAPLPRWSSVAAGAAGLVVLLAWISTEVTSALDRAAASDQAVQFSLSAVWSCFAAVMFAAGVRLRSRWVRLGAVLLFALVGAKLAFADLWTLSTSYRVVAFMGLGAVLLACSLAYYRFRTYILGEDSREAAAGRPTASA